MRSALLPLALALGLVLPACTGSGTLENEPADSLDTGPGPAIGEDQDGDSILDIHEGYLAEDDGASAPDTDGDGDPDYLDTDADGDDIIDYVEAGDPDLATLPIDSDGDALADYVDGDSDNNCITDRDEKHADGTVPGDFDDDGTADYRDFDNDGDGILDIVELGEACAAVDSDYDGTPDYMDTDSDNDGVGDIWEAGTNPDGEDPVDTDGDGIPDYLDVDSDGDNISDSDESGTSSWDEEPRDTDGDGEYDFADTDADGDGLLDNEELGIYGTDPYDSDSDGDGFSDGGEITAGTDPNDASSVIDGIYVEVAERSKVEEEFDFELQIRMGDVAFMVDTTCSMSSTAQAMASEYSEIVTQIALTIDDAEYGYATFDDYPYGGYGSEGIDKPFELRKQITSSTSQVQTTMASTSIHSGADGPESSMEAIYQATTGIGYDQDCNTVYDESTDVRPFLASSDDPYGGLGGQSWSAKPPGGGEYGGFGFRDYALPVVVYATDNYMRDPENGYGTPGGCPQDAGFSDVVGALAELGGYAIGVCTSTTCTPQMEDLAEATGAYADTDGDGSIDDLLVFEWSGSDEDFRNTVVGAIEDLVSAIQFQRIELEIIGDEWGFVTAVNPEYYDDVDELGAGTTVLSFTLNFRGAVAATTEDQLYALTFNVLGDETILLDTLDIIVVVPGTSY